jgi:glycosyltransferase involved in cell wall biosynthesis
MRVLVARTQVPFVRGGSEVLGDSLVSALRHAGHLAELVAIPFNWEPPARILDHMLAAKLLDLSHTMGQPIDRVVALNFPTYYLSATRKTLWLQHLHRPIYDLWEHAYASLAYTSEGAAVRSAIMAADRLELGAIDARFAISRRVAERLRRHLAYDADVLHPPLNDPQGFRCAPDEPFIFFPSRVASLKRQCLAVRAMGRSKAKIKLVLAGAPDTSETLAELTTALAENGSSGQVEYLGHIGEEKKRELYARCRAVLYPPYDEDYGFVTIEAMQSSKPVITCADSGGPLEFVVPGETGIVAQPDEDGLVEAIARFAERPDEARRMGEAGKARVETLGLNWPDTVDRLLA